VLFLVEQIVSKHCDKVELLVINNCSTDDTVALLAPLESKGVTLVNRSVHLPSAEANMFASLEHCRGRYIWFHGDDDIPVVQTVEWLLQTLGSDDVDMYIFNGVAIDNDGGQTSERFLKMNRTYLDLIGDDIVFACGFLYTLAGISNVVLRRSKASGKLAKEIIGLQEIYAHVVWLLRCFSSSRVRLIAQPLVFYRVDDPQKTYDHFVRYAIRNKIGNHYVWSFGLIRLLKYLLESGTLSAEGISRIYDGRRDGTRFRALDDTIHHIYLQIKSGIFSEEKRNIVTKEEFNLARDFLYRVDLFSFDSMAVLEKLIVMQERKNKVIFWRRKVDRLCKQFEEVFRAQHKDNYYRPLRSGTLMGFRIYKTPSGFVALSNKIHHRREEILSYMDPLDEYPNVLVGESLELVQVSVARTIQDQQKLALSNHDSAAIQVADGLYQIGHNIKIIGDLSHKLSGLRTDEIELQRQSTFALRLLTYRLLFGPLRRVWVWALKK
jgi:glycosyltransferase involved in cell wall biosynthesis